jgi:hypothetical protein
MVQPEELARLKESVRLVAAAAVATGKAPPCPPTIRGRLGGLAVRLVGRLLWWYTPKVAHFESAAARAAMDQAEVMEALARAQSQLAVAVEAIRSDLVAIERRITDLAARRPPG